MDEFPGNSRRPINPEKTTPAIEDVKLESVVTGRVIRRKKSLGRRIRETLFNGDSGVFSYLLKEVLVPALQATATDMVTQGIEKAVYGEVRSPGRSMRGNTGPRTHISYDRPGIMGRSSPSRPIPARRPIVQASAMDLGEYIVSTKIEAQVIVDKLYETVEDYGCATVANLNELMNQSSEYTDHKWGWTDLTNMTVKRIAEGYLLVLPDPEDLR